MTASRTEQARTVSRAQCAARHAGPPDPELHFLTSHIGVQGMGEGSAMVTPRRETFLQHHRIVEMQADAWTIVQTLGMSRTVDAATDVPRAFTSLTATIRLCDDSKQGKQVVPDSAKIGQMLLSADSI